MGRLRKEKRGLTSFFSPECERNGLGKKIETESFGDSYKHSTNKQSQQTKQMSNAELENRIQMLESVVLKLTDKLSMTNLEEGSKKSGAKAKEPKATKKDGTLRKKPSLSGYMLFSNENRAQAKDDLLQDKEKLARGELMKRLGEMWKALDEEERQDYNSRAKEASTSEDDEE